jgi:hypothetical protein
MGSGVSLAIGVQSLQEGELKDKLVVLKKGTDESKKKLVLFELVGLTFVIALG